MGLDELRLKAPNSPRGPNLKVRVFELSTRAACWKKPFAVPSRAASRCGPPCNVCTAPHGGAARYCRAQRRRSGISSFSLERSGQARRAAAGLTRRTISAPSARSFCHNVQHNHHLPQAKRDKLVARLRLTPISAATRDDNVLLTVDRIGAWSSEPASGQIMLPQRLAGP